MKIINIDNYLGKWKGKKKKEKEFRFKKKMGKGFEDICFKWIYISFYYLELRIIREM